jgi:hypothetical protein
VYHVIMGTEDWARATDMGLAALDTACWNDGQEQSGGEDGRD